MNPKGNGLGLSICKHICTDLGGEITVRSVYGVGSSFAFTMKVFNALASSSKKISGSLSHESMVSKKNFIRLEEAIAMLTDSDASSDKSLTYRSNNISAPHT